LTWRSADEMLAGPVVTVTNLTLGPSLKARVETRTGLTSVALIGNLNEAGNLAPLAQLPGPIAIDLGELHRINSVGVRYWMDFVRDREKAGVALTFERCSPMLVGQISMITHFMGSRSRVKSLLVPYFCPACKAEHLDTLTVAPGAQVRRALACPRCGAPMEVDDLVETYEEALLLV
jgi:hypothetical protein